MPKKLLRFRMQQLRKLRCQLQMYLLQRQELPLKQNSLSLQTKPRMYRSVYCSVCRSRTR